jgi:ClpP class serine protease
MPTWNEINREAEALIKAGTPDPYDHLRKKYLAALEARAGKPVIAYYSGFLLRRDNEGRFHPECAIGDLDMNGLMAVSHGIDKNSGLDLILHTPGGGIEAGRSIVEYLYKMFGKDIRVIVPHMAMSVGTMIACAAREILLGKHSSLGPTDPQIRGLPAMGVLAEIDRALEEIRADPLRNTMWQHVFSKYIHPGSSWTAREQLRAPGQW